MECLEAQPYVSTLYDGESVPKTAAEHIAACPSCKERLRAYSEIGLRLRLLASSTGDENPVPFPMLAPGRPPWFWTRSLTARVLVPRFVVALAIAAILGLPIGLGLMWAETSGLWFKFRVTSPEGQDSWGSQVQAGTMLGPTVTPMGPELRAVTQFRVLEVRKDRIRLAVRAIRVKFEALQEATFARGGPHEALGKLVASAPEQQLVYIPGKELEIPVTGGGKLTLTGSVSEHPEPLYANYPITPQPDQMVVRDAAIVRDKELLGSKLGSGWVEADDPGVAFYVPQAGLLILMLHPIEGAVEAQADFGQVHFTLDGHHYVLFSATPITGGDQPRTIWVYRNPDVRSPAPDRPVFGGMGRVSQMLKEMK